MDLKPGKDWFLKLLDIELLKFLSRNRLISTYMYIRKAHTYFVQHFLNLVKVDVLEVDGGNGSSCLYTPVLLKGIQRTITIEIEGVTL